MTRVEEKATPPDPSLRSRMTRGRVVEDDKGVMLRMTGVEEKATPPDPSLRSRMTRGRIVEDDKEREIAASLRLLGIPIYIGTG